MTLPNADEAKRIVRRYLKISNNWLDEDIAEIERTIDLIVEAAADKARHDLAKNHEPQLAPASAVAGNKIDTHPFKPTDPYGGCLTCGMHVTHEAHTKVANTLARVVVEMLEDSTITALAQRDPVVNAMCNTLRFALVLNEDDIPLGARDILERACHIDPFGDAHNARIRDDARALLSDAEAFLREWATRKGPTP